MHGCIAGLHSLQPVPAPTKGRLTRCSRRVATAFAVRCAHFFGPVNAGCYHFYGTSRQPTLIAGVDPLGRPVLAPCYELMHQVGLDAQLTQTATLWKLEGLYRSGQGDDTLAVSLGVEHTLVGVMSTAADFGLLAEYHFDTNNSGNALHLADDWFVGVRLSANDVQSSELLIGVLVDRSEPGYSFNLEASSRWGSSWTAELEARVFNDYKAPDQRVGLNGDDHVQLTVLRHF